MKFLMPFGVILCLLFSIEVEASTACNTGNLLYPNATGGVNQYGDPLYYNSSPITIRWWDQDPNCGIRDNRIKPRSSGDDNCQIVGGNYGVIYTYSPSDNNCIPLPLDDYIPVILLLASLTGGYYIRNKRAIKQAV